MVFVQSFLLPYYVKRSMPESRNRTKHHHQHHQPVAPHHNSQKIKRSAALVVAILAAILGLAVAYFTQGSDPLWMMIGTLAGAIVGYLVGHAMDKSIAKT